MDDNCDGDDNDDRDDNIQLIFHGIQNRDGKLSPF
jgi:hypothetical protein